MPNEVEVIASGNLLHVKATGKLTADAYEHFVPLAEELIEARGKLRVLLELHDFHGWTAGALWEDLKFDLKHWSHIERLAIVGESKWEAGMAAFCKPFTSATIRYFDHADADEARAWIEAESD